MLRSVSNSMPRWRLLAEIRKRRQLAAAMAQRQQQQEQQQQQQQQEPYAHLHHQQSPENAFYSGESLFSAAHQATTVPTPAAQQVLSLFQQNPQQPIYDCLNQASFPPSAENLVSLLDQLFHYPQLPLQTLIWSLRCPGFSVSPDLASRVAPILPLPKPPSVERFLSDAHAFWMQPELPVLGPVVDPLLSLYCYASPSIDDIIDVLNLIISKGGTVGIHHFNLVLQTAVSKQHNQLERAEWVFKYMIKNGPRPNLTAYNTMIYGYAEAGNTDEALRLFEEMNASSLPVNEATYSSVIAAVMKTGDLDKAIWYMKEMKYNGMQALPQTYSAVLIGLCGKGKHEVANMLLSQMRTEGTLVDDYTHQTMVSALCSVLGVQSAEAHRLLYEERKEAQTYF